MVKHKHTPGPWSVAYLDPNGQAVVKGEHIEVATCWHHSVGSIEKEMRHNSLLIAAAPELLVALHEGRRAIGDHSAPYDCYATGPVTGDSYRDLVQCPACSFIAMYDAAIAKATGEATA